MRRSLSVWAFVLWGLLPQIGNAATIPAATCSAIDVQRAIDIAYAGDTVRVPAGDCTWTTTVRIANKAVRLIGAGVGTTNITDQGSGGAALLLVGASRSTFVNVSGFTFIKSSNHAKGIVQIYGTSPSNSEIGFRFHDNQILQATSGSAGIGVYWVYGVIDRNAFNVTAGRGSIQSIIVEGASSGSGSGSPAIQPKRFGSADAVYVEDNTIRHVTPDAGVMDTYAGARLVFRHNIVAGAPIGFPLEGKQGGSSVEIYRNTIMDNGGSRSALTLRDGAGLFFNNTFGSSCSNCGFKVEIRDQELGSQTTGACTGLGDDCKRFERTASAAFAPSYEWINGAMHISGPDGLGGSKITENRDYYNFTTPFDGSKGVGVGPLSGRPTNCKPAVAYFAEDKNVLYQCVSGNTWSEYYTPFTYPHPLRAGDWTSSADSTSPSPGGAGAITSNVTPTQVALIWAKASDNTTAQGALQYATFLSTRNDIRTVTDAEAYGAILQPYTANISSTVVPAWAPGTTYYFNVIVKDEAGNKAAYGMSSVTLPMTKRDVTSPVAGAGGQIFISNLGPARNPTGVLLTWIKATDNATADSALQYATFLSTRNDIRTVADAEAFGALVQPFKPNVSSITVPSWAPGTTYYFNVIVKDEAGNKTAYAMNSAALSLPRPDFTAPLPGGNGQIDVESLSPTEATLSWGDASDDETTRSKLQYELRLSTSGNLSSVGNAEINGSVAKAYTPELNTHRLTGLNPASKYFVNVIVRDEAGNKTVYAMRTVSTPPAPDTAPPVPRNGGRITTTATQESVRLSWPKATDNVTTPPVLQYAAFISKKNNIDTVEKAEANGVAIQSFVPDSGAFVATGLSANTTYYFNVIVRDEANNKTAYTMASVTTSAAPEPEKKSDAPKVESGTTSLVSPDLVPPVPGGSKNIKISNVSANGLTLSWPAATDNLTPTIGLEYEVRQSPRKNIGTVSEAEANGTILMPYTAGATSFEVAGLQAGSNYYFNVIVRDAAGNKAPYIPTGDVSRQYSFVERGAESMTTTVPATLPLNVGNVRVAPSIGSTTPAGLAIIRNTRSGGLISETSVTLSEEILSGSAYVEVTGSNEAGDALVTRITLSNSSSQDALISFHLVNEVGVQIRSGVFTLPANLQITRLMDQSPFEAPLNFRGTFSFNSSIPIGIAGMRGVRNAKGELTLSTLPIFSGRASGPVIPFFATGGSVSTEVVLMNPSTTTQTGSVQFFGVGSATTKAPLLTLTVNGVSSSIFNYSVPPRSVIRLQAENDASEIVTGTVRISSDATAIGSPDAFAVLTYKANGVVTSEATVPAVSLGTAFRSYVESKIDKDGVTGGVGIANASGVSNVVNFEYVGFDGTPRAAVSSITLAPGAMITRWAHELFPEVPSPSRGLLRVTSSAPIAVTTLRAGYNQPAVLLPSFLPSWNDDGSPLLGSAVFPLIVAGGGYNTELILFGQAGRSGDGKLLFTSQDGVPVPASSLGVVP